MRSIPLFKVKMSEGVMAPLQDVLYSGYIGQGPKVDEFEQKLGDYFGNPNVTTVNSCTSAIHLALHRLKTVAEGRDEILTSPMTCSATNIPILANGLKLKWVDVDPDTGNMDLLDLARKITPKTLAIIVVHWGGYPIDLDALDKIKERLVVRSERASSIEASCGLPIVIEDCAHAFGSTYKGKRLGNHGNICCYSFQAIKHLTTGDGGCLVTPTEYAKKCMDLLRWYGLDRKSSADFRCAQDITDWGYKFHMNDIAATIGIENLKEVDTIVELHKMNAQWLRDQINRRAKTGIISGVHLLKQEPDRESASWIFTMRVDNRDEFIRKMNSNGVAAGRVHARNDKHSCFSESRCLLPGTDIFANEMVCLPCGWWVTDEDREYIVDCIEKGW